MAAQLDTTTQVRHVPCITADGDDFSRMAKRVLVTGAGGFIGSHLVEALGRRNLRVRALVHYNARGSAGWLDELDGDTLRSVEIVAGDIRDLSFIQGAVRGCDVVFHLAALIGIPYSYTAPAQYVETNVVGSLNVLQAARDQGVKRVVHTSTSEVYGTAQFVPISEDHPLVGQSPYAATKIGADQLALSFHHSFGTPVAVIRPFNTYGPRQSTRAVIPTIITQLLARPKTVELGALTPTRDFNFVGDIAEAFIAVAEAETAIGKVINVGTGFEVSIGNLFEMISEIIGVKVSVGLDRARVRPVHSEVDRLCADSARATRLTGWCPTLTGAEGLRTGLAATVDWFRTRAAVAPSRYAV
jgi:NAD dependent epimerase/dehydratase